MKSISGFGLVMILVGVAGCAQAVPPQELVSARSGYDRAARGPASTLDPTDLHTAKEALDVAETAFKNDGDTQQTRDLGYTAGRKTEIAESRARTMQTAAEKEAIVNGMHAGTEAQARLTSAELGKANKQIVSKDQALANETQRRQDAEKRAAQSAADLARIASVKQEPRGMVITLSGSVLFATNKTELLPAAQVKLNDVAKALTEQDPDSKMVVEGHTDSQGTAAINQDLSQRRAQAVRDYLVSRGIASDRITAEGFGPTRSIADNASPEGRANNRRVEIVVKPKS